MEVSPEHYLHYLFLNMFVFVIQFLNLIKSFEIHVKHYNKSNLSNQVKPPIQQDVLWFYIYYVV